MPPPTTRISPAKTRSSETPPTSWRPPNPSTNHTDTTNTPDRRRSSGSQDTPRATLSPPSRSASLSRVPLDQRKSNELVIRQHVTKDSMLDNILLSFNQMPDGQGPLPKNPPMYSSFKDGEFKLDSPCFVYDAISQLSTHSRSSSVDSTPDLKQESAFSPYQIRTTPIRRSSLAKPGTTINPRPTHNRSFSGPPSSKASSKKIPSPTPRARPRQEPSAMIVDNPREHIIHRKSRSVAAGMDFGTYGADQPRWLKQRGGGISKDLTSSVSATPRSLAGTGTSNNHIFLDLDRTPSKPTIWKVEDNYANSPPPYISPTRINKIQLSNDSTPQWSTHDQVAIVPDSEFLSAERSQHPIADQRYRPQQLASVRSPDAMESDAPILKRTKSQPFIENPRERAGFLKRVFGSSKVIPHMPDEDPSPAPAPSGIEDEEMHRTNLLTTESVPDPSAASTLPFVADSQPSEVDWSDILKAGPSLNEPIPVLNKKPSFFRRRKKISEREELRDFEAAKDVPFSVITPIADESPLRDSPMDNLRNAAEVYLSTPTSVQNSKLAVRLHGSGNGISPRSAPLFPREAPFSGSPAGGKAGLSANIYQQHSSGYPEQRRRRPSLDGHEKPSLYTSDLSRQLSPCRNIDDDVFDDPTPVSLLSSQLRNVAISANESLRSTPVPSPLSRAEYTSLQTMRTTGLAICTNSSMPLLPQHDGSSFASAPQTDDSALKATRRIWITPDDSDEDMAIPIRNPRLPPQTPPSVRSTVLAKAGAAIAMSPGGVSPFSNDHCQANSSFAESELPLNPLAPTAVDIELATRLYFGEEDTALSPTELLGQPGAAGERLRQAYMEMLDLDGVSILSTLRQLCSRLIIRGESQQIGRILVSLSQRWCECHQHSGSKHEAIVNSVLYALLLLNTDLHVADMDEKMSRAQFVKNTMTAIRQIILDKSFEDSPHGDHNDSFSKMNASYVDFTSQHANNTAGHDRPSLDTRNSQPRVSTALPARPLSGVSSFTGTPRIDTRMDEPLDVLLSTSLDSYNKSWEPHIEAALKNYYNSIRQQSLPLSGTSDLTEKSSNPSTSVRSSMMKRSGSVMKQGPSEFNRGYAPPRRTIGSRWNPRNRSKGVAAAIATAGTGWKSVEDVAVVSPSTSSTWSKTMTRTQTSASSDSFGENHKPSESWMNPTVGFVSALNYAMDRVKGIAPASVDSATKSIDDSTIVNDEILMLAGAPWAKEGLVHHKHHLENAEKRAKERNWVQCFAVVEKGNMRLFSFTSKASVRSQRNKSKKGGAVGGGNWTESAESLGVFPLRHTLAAVLPPPGHKDRPYIFSLRLVTGAVHFFQVGTPEIAEEFASTVNYWSARLSKEPLVGGVSNIEYGWSDSALDNATLVEFSTPNFGHTLTASSPNLEVPSRRSFSGSIRSNSEGHRAGPRLKFPGDRLNVADWTPPTQNLIASALSEADQIAALTKYVDSVKDELAIHNELRPNLLGAYSVRHPNYTKVMANWEKKSAYLLAESTRFSTYIDSLIAAQSQHEKLKKEKESELECNK